MLRVFVVVLALLQASAPRFADEDPSNDALVGPPDFGADCAEQLAALQVRYRARPIKLRGEHEGTYTCGNEHSVLYVRGPSGIKYNAPPLVACGLALALVQFERVAGEQARQILGKRIRRIEHGGTYSCRHMQRFRDMVSEHSYANAIDIRAFVLEDGRRVSVAQDFGSLDAEPKTAKGRFLRSLARRLYDEAIFSVVLTPYWDKLHRDHFHLDLARYRVDGTRP